MRLKVEGGGGGGGEGKLRKIVVRKNAGGSQEFRSARVRENAKETPNQFSLTLPIFYFTILLERLPRRLLSNFEAVDCSNSHYLDYMSFIQCIDWASHLALPLFFVHQHAGVDCVLHSYTQAL